MVSGADDAMRSPSPLDDTDSATRAAVPDNASVPKPKRLACMICRKRKLKCDGLRPSCSTCSRLGHSCAYDEQRRKSGPKRGYVKALEERLKQVETLLKTQDPTAAAASTPSTARNPPNSMLGMAAGNPQPNAGGINVASSGLGLGTDLEMDGWQMNGDSPQAGKDFNFNSMPMPMSGVTGDFTWEMIGLGLEEPLPPQETIDELHQIYFEKVHPSIPMIHKYRYLAAMNLAPAQRPPVCLRYAMWTMACVITDKFVDLKDLFYQRARKYLETDYMKGFGEHMISLAHCQTHILLSSYEMRSMYFPRAWINTGSAARLAQMVGLHRLDGSGLEVKQCLPSPKDWTEREERRRTFWMSFCQDRYASIGTGWPMIIDEKDILTNLPASDEAFDLSRPEQTGTLEEALAPSGAAKVSSFGGIVLTSCLFGRNLTHLHRPDADDLDNDLNGPFWKRHRQMDNILLNTFLCLPDQLKLPSGINNANVVFTNMCIHTSAICLHQAAIFKAEKHKLLPSSVSSDSKVRCITAANEIASIMRNVSHLELSSLNPFICFCLYVAARVFVQYLKSRPDDSQIADSLRFLLLAMNTLKKRNPLTESFLVQLDVDFEALMARNPKLRAAFVRPGDGPDGLNILGRVAPAGAVCDDPDAVKGILSYRNECNFMKVTGDSGNLADEPSIVDGRGGDTNMDPGPNYANGQWLDPEHVVQQTLTPSSGMGHGNNGARFGDGNGEGREASGSPDDGLSSGLTPNSSSATGSNRLQPGSHLNPSGSSSFQASPNLPGVDSATAPGPTTSNGGGGATFFGDLRVVGDAGPSFVMQTGLGQQDNTRVGNYGSIGGGWPETQQDHHGQPQQEMSSEEVGDGVLNAFMNMGPLDTMNLSAPWTGAGPGEMR